MIQSTKDIISLLFGGAWSMMGVTFPGTTFSFRQIFLGVFIGSTLIVVIRWIFGLGSNSESSGGTGISGGNNRRIRINDSRKGDTK